MSFKINFFWENLRLISNYPVFIGYLIKNYPVFVNCVSLNVTATKHQEPHKRCNESPVPNSCAVEHGKRGGCGSRGAGGGRDMSAEEAIGAIAEEADAEGGRQGVIDLSAED